jgi:hypothetical protein
MGKIGGPEARHQHRVLAVGEISIEHLRAQAHAVAQRPFGPESADKAPAHLADIRLQQKHRRRREGKIHPICVEVRTGGPRGEIDEEIVRRQTDADACGLDRIKAAAQMNIHPRRVWQQLGRALGTGPVAVHFHTDEGIAACPIVAELAAGNAACRLLIVGGDLNDRVLVGAVGTPPRPAAVRADIGTIERSSWTTHADRASYRVVSRRRGTGYDGCDSDRERRSFHDSPRAQCSTNSRLRSLASNTRDARSRCCAL